MNRIAPTVLATTILVGSMALAPEAHGHTMSADLTCEEDTRNLRADFRGTDWPAGPQVVNWTLTIDGEPYSGTTNYEQSVGGSFIAPAPAETFTAELEWNIVGTDGFRADGEIERSLTCWSSPPPSEVTPTPTPPVTSPTTASAPRPPAATSPLPTPSTPEAGTPPSTPPKRTVKKRTVTRVVRGCLGPWPSRPKIPGVRARKAFDGRYYGFRDVRRWRTTYITIRQADGTVKRGRRVHREIVSFGSYCGPLRDVGVTG